MRLKNRILLIVLIVVMSAAIGVAVAGIPRNSPLDPVLESIVTTTSTTTTTTTVAPVSTITTTVPPTTTTIPADMEVVVEILNAGAGLRGAALAADSLDLSLATEVILGDAPVQQDQSFLLYRSVDSLLIEGFLNANPQLEMIESNVVSEEDQWPEWASLTASIVIVVGANWPGG